jgi:hypothetical protein
MALPFILYDNIFDNGAISATSEVGSVQNIKDWRSYVRWSATSTATQYVTVDHGTAVACDGLGIAGHNLSGATLSVASSTTGAWAGEQVTRLAPFTPTDNADICKPFTSASARYWRLKILTPSEVPEIGVLCLGPRMDFPIYPDKPLDFKQSQMEADESVSKGGHLLGVTTRFEPYTFSLSFTYIDYSWIVANFDVFWKAHGKTHTPFFVNINADLWSDGRFCKFPDSFSYTQQFTETDFMEVLMLSFEGVE